MSNNSLYNLLYVDLDGKIYNVNSDTWTKDDQWTFSDSNLEIVNSYLKASKITQLHNGKFLYLATNCSVYICDADFTNSKLISDKKFYSITQTSNYNILLSSKDGIIYSLKSIYDFNPTQFYNDSNIYSCIKQTYNSKILAIQGNPFGNTYVFDLTKTSLTNKKIVTANDGWKNRVSVFLPDQSSVINLDCQAGAEKIAYKYTFSSSDGDYTLKSKRSDQCDYGEEQSDGLCYTKCKDGYKGIATVCWQTCDGDIDTGATCMEKCKDGYTNKAGICYYDANPSYYDRGAGTVPDYTCPSGYNVNGVTCLKDPPTGFHTNPGDISTYWNDNKHYDRGAGTVPDYSCPSGYTRSTLTCVKDPPSGYHVNDGDISTYWNDNKHYDRGAGTIPNYTCDKGYTRSGTNCVPDAPSGYHINDGDIVSYWNDKYSYDRGVGTIPTYGTCNKSGLTNVVDGVSTCTGWDSCNKKIKTDQWGVDGGRCGKKKTCPGCSRTKWSGWRNTISKTYWDSDCNCYEADNSCTWTNESCVGSAITRDRPASCSSDRQIESGMCYKKPSSGYKCVVTSCTSDNPASKLIDASKIKQATQSCSSGKELIAGLCYDKPKDGYVCNTTSCDPTPLSKTIDPTSNKTATGSCPSGKEMVAGLCYDKPKDGYVCNTTSCDPDPLSKMIDPSTSKSASPDCGSKELVAGLCYDKPKDGFICNSTACSVKSYVPDTYSKKSYDRGVGRIPIQTTSSAVSCTDDCCISDLAFYNPNYLKPTSLTLPNIPVTSGLFAYYDASSFKNNIWYDLTPNNNNVVYLNGTVNIDPVKNYLYGDVNTSMLFPCEVLPDNYTIFHICKYNGNNQGAILSGYDNNWISGFYQAKSGIAYHGGLNTQKDLSLFDNRWVFSTDLNTKYRANLNDYTTSNAYNKSCQLAINMNDDIKNNSDWAIACVIVFDKNLSDSDINIIEKWLITTYSSLWYETYSETLSQLGYSCYNNNVGKVTKNYTNYEYATYNNKDLIKCESLYYPQKAEVKSLTCSESSTILDIEPKYIDSEIISEIISETTSETNSENSYKINSEIIYKTNPESLCKTAFDNYNLYPSTNPLVVRGNDIYSNLTNSITDKVQLNNIGTSHYNTFNKIVSDYNPNDTDTTKKVFDEILKETPLKMGCCFRKLNDNAARSVLVRTPLDPENTDETFKKFDFQFESMKIPENTCPVDYYADSDNCNAFYDVYCANVIDAFNKQKLSVDDFLTYAPECACYAPKTDAQAAYPDVTPPACYKDGCQLGNASYLDTVSRNTPCDLTVCSNIFNVSNITAGGNVTIDPKLENTCGDYLPKTNTSTNSDSTTGVSSNTAPATSSSNTAPTTSSSNTTPITSSNSGSASNSGSTSNNALTSDSSSSSNYTMIIIIVVVILLLISCISLFMKKKK